MSGKLGLNVRKWSNNENNLLENIKGVLIFHEHYNIDLAISVLILLSVLAAIAVCCSWHESLLILLSRWLIA